MVLLFEATKLIQGMSKAGVQQQKNKAVCDEITHYRLRLFLLFSLSASPPLPVYGAHSAMLGMCYV
jgi:hypothetical protein